MWNPLPRMLREFQPMYLSDLHRTGKLAFPVVFEGDVLGVSDAGRGRQGCSAQQKSLLSQHSDKGHSVCLQHSSSSKLEYHLN